MIEERFSVAVFPHFYHLQALVDRLLSKPYPLNGNFMASKDIVLCHGFGFMGTLV